MLRELYFAHEHAFLIPVEALSPEGLDAGYAQALRDLLAIEDGWIEQFNRGFALYWQRAQALAARRCRWLVRESRGLVCRFRVATRAIWVSRSTASGQCAQGSIDFEIEVYRVDTFGSLSISYTVSALRICVDRVQHEVRFSPTHSALLVAAGIAVKARNLPN